MLVIIEHNNKVVDGCRLKMIKLLTLVLLFSGFIQSGTSIHCYVCNSINNTICTDPSSYDQETLRRFLVLADCGEGVITPQRYFCRKIEQTIFHTNREYEFRVTRGCGWLRSHLDCYKNDNEDHMETICQCFEDGCNGATSIAAKWHLLIASVVVVIIKWC